MEMSEAAKKAQREYKREWNRRNKDKVRASQIKYWEKKALEKKAAALHNQLTANEEFNREEFSIPESWNADLKLKGLEDESF